MSLPRENLMLFFMFLAFALLLRVFSFFPLVLDHDESTYLVIAEALLKGKVYLVDVIDTKPIGIFWIYAGILKLFGKSIIITRIFACIALAGTSLIIYLLQLKWIQNKTAALWSALLYIAILSVFKRWGMSPNTEIYFNLFSVLAIYLSLAFKNRFFDLLTGVCMGIAFHIKYVALADCAALVAFLCISAFYEKRLARFLVDRLLYFAIGFIILTLAILIYYVQHSALDEFLYYTFRISGNYATSFALGRSLIFIGDFFFRFFPLTVLIFLSFRSAEFRNHPMRLLLILWFVLDMCIIIIPGKYFEHYFIQIVPVCCLVAGNFFNTTRGLRVQNVLIGLKSGIAIALVLTALLIAHYNSFIKKPEPLREILYVLKNKLQPDDILYTSNAHHILYFLLEKESPTPYIHSSLLWNEKHRQTLQLDGKHEIQKILAKHPDYILWSESNQDPEMQKLLLAGYHKIQTINDRSFLYKRND